MTGEPSVAGMVEAMAQAFRDEMNRIEGEGRHQSHDLESLRGIPAAFRGLLAYLAEQDILVGGDGTLIRGRPENR